MGLKSAPVSYSFLMNFMGHVFYSHNYLKRQVKSKVLNVK